MTSFLETTTIMHDNIEEETTMQGFEDNMTEEDVDDPVTTIPSLLHISSTLSPKSHITECPLCECTCPTLSPIIKIHPTPPEESSLNSTSMHLYFCMTSLHSFAKETNTFSE